MGVPDLNLTISNQTSFGQLFHTMSFSVNFPCVCSNLFSALARFWLALQAEFGASRVVCACGLTLAAMTTQASVDIHAYLLHIAHTNKSKTKIVKDT